MPESSMEKRFEEAVRRLELELLEAGRRLAQLEALVETAISDLRDQIDACAVAGAESEARIRRLETRE